MIPGRKERGPIVWVCWVGLGKRRRKGFIRKEVRDSGEKNDGRLPWGGRVFTICTNTRKERGGQAKGAVLKLR